MGDDLVDRPAELLVDKIKQYLTQYPLKSWKDARKWLLDDGDIARKRIDELGPDLFFALKDQFKGSSAQAEVTELTPPRSPKLLNSQQRQSGDDEWSDSGCQDVTDTGPCMDNKDRCCDILAKLIHPSGRSAQRGSFSAKFCKGPHSFINKDTIERRDQLWCVDTDANTVVLEWRAHFEYQEEIGDSGFHQTTCKVVPPEQMQGNDVALAAERKHWDRPSMNVGTLVSTGASGGLRVASEAQGIDRTIGRLIFATAVEMHKRPLAEEDEDLEARGPSRRRFR